MFTKYSYFSQTSLYDSQVSYKLVYWIWYAEPWLRPQKASIGCASGRAILTTSIKLMSDLSWFSFQRNETRKSSWLCISSGYAIFSIPIPFSLSWSLLLGTSLRPILVVEPPRGLWDPISKKKNSSNDWKLKQEKHDEYNWMSQIGTNTKSMHQKANFNTLLRWLYQH